MTKPSPAIVACRSDAARPGRARSLPRFLGAGSWRPPVAFAALLLACVLPLAGFVPHEHDEEDAGGDHHCVICCPPHHGATTSAAAPSVATPDVAVLAVSRTRRGIGPGTTLGIRPTRGPPA